MAKEDAFLFTDIEGSTQLWQNHIESMAEALALHDAALQGAVESAGGTASSSAPTASEISQSR